MDCVQDESVPEKDHRHGPCIVIGNFLSIIRICLSSKQAFLKCKFANIVKIANITMGKITWFTVVAFSTVV